MAEAIKRGKEEAAAAQKAAAEGITEELGGTGEGADRRVNTPAEMSNWERMVELVWEAFGERQITEETMWQAVVLIFK